MQLKTAAKAGIQTKKKAEDPLLEIDSASYEEYVNEGIAAIYEYTKSKDAIRAVKGLFAMDEDARRRLDCTYLKSMANQTLSAKAVIASIKAVSRMDWWEREITLDMLSMPGMDDSRDVVRCARIFGRLKPDFNTKEVARWAKDVIDISGSSKVTYLALKTLSKHKKSDVNRNRVARNIRQGLREMLSFMEDDKTVRNGFLVDFIRCAFPASNTSRS